MGAAPEDWKTDLRKVSCMESSRMAGDSKVARDSGRLDGWMGQTLTTTCCGSGGPIRFPQCRTLFQPNPGEAPNERSGPKAQGDQPDGEPSDNRRSWPFHTVTHPSPAHERSGSGPDPELDARHRAASPARVALRQRTRLHAAPSRRPLISVRRLRRAVPGRAVRQGARAGGRDLPPLQPDDTQRAGRPRCCGARMAPPASKSPWPLRSSSTASRTAIRR